MTFMFGVGVGLTIGLVIALIVGIVVDKIWCDEYVRATDEWFELAKSLMGWSGEDNNG